MKIALKITIFSLASGLATASLVGCNTAPNIVPPTKTATLNDQAQAIKDNPALSLQAKENLIKQLKK